MTGAARDSSGKCIEPADFIEILEENLNKILKSPEFKDIGLEEGVSITKIRPDQDLWFMSWVGAAVVPWLETAWELFIGRDKWVVGEFDNIEISYLKLWNN